MVNIIPQNMYSPRSRMRRLSSPVKSQRPFHFRWVPIFFFFAPLPISAPPVLNFRLFLKYARMVVEKTSLRSLIGNCTIFFFSRIELTRSNWIDRSCLGSKQRISNRDRKHGLPTSDRYQAIEAHIHATIYLQILMCALCLAEKIRIFAQLMQPLV